MKDNQVSSTALLIAKSFVLQNRDRQISNLMSQDIAELSSLFVAECEQSSHYEKLVNNYLYRLVVRILETITIPGIFLHYLLRKNHIEEAVNPMLSGSITQMVVLAGGFDTLGLRVHKQYSEKQFIELDHPVTQNIKKQVVEDNNLANNNFNLVPIDFTKDSFAAILGKQPYFRGDTPSLFIAEGITMYLSDDEIDDLFKSVHNLCGTGSYFIFTYMEKRQNGSLQFYPATKLADIWLAWKNEPFKWGIENSKLESFLQQRGFKLSKLTTSKELKESLPLKLQNRKLANGENICIAEVTK